jgi:replicative DNA helicase Mcm
MIRDEVRVEDDELIGRHIMDMRTQGVSEFKIEEALDLDPAEGQVDQTFATSVDKNEHFTLEFLRKYIAYAKRNIHPDLDENARAEILNYYTNERQSFGRDDQSGESEVIPITARALEALIRLTEAHARMHLRDTASSEDARVALAVFRHWREESGIEDESELYSGVSASARATNTLIRSIIRDICSEGDGSANLTEIYNRASVRKVSETTVDDVLSRLRMSGEVFSPRNDVYQFAR